MAPLSFRNVSKTFGDRVRAVDDLTLEIGDGEVMVLVGPSGCGKTTALRMVAGLERVDSGDVAIGTRIVNDVEPQNRDIAMVFQNYALYPHMDVFANLAFGLKARRVPKVERKTRVEEIARVLGLADLLRRRPAQLSGGQRQRVAMGRAIVREPSVWLMDEPLSNLDAKLRVQMRVEISRLQLELGVTTLYVTHDQVEALTIGSRVAVMRAGRVQQVASPQRVYDAPANLFVAGFIGSPAMNFRLAEVVSVGAGIGVRIGEYLTTVADSSGLGRFAGTSVAVGFRPEHLELASAHSSGPRLRGRVVLTESVGSALLVHMECEGRAVQTDDVLEALSDGGEESTEIPFTPREGVVHIAQLATDTDVRTGDPVEVAIDPHRMRFFDVASGAAIDDVRPTATCLYASAA